MNVEYKIDNISKTNDRKIIKLRSKSVSEHWATFGTKKSCVDDSKNFERSYLKKTENRRNLKIYFSFAKIGKKIIFFFIRKNLFFITQLFERKQKRGWGLHVVN